MTLSIVLVIGIAAAVILLLPIARPSAPLWLLACSAYLLLDAACVLGAPRLAGAHWNWVGKAASLVLALVAAAVLRVPRRGMGLALPSGRPAWIWTLAAIAVAVAFSGLVNDLLRDHRPVGAETYAFEATMPGLAEEPSYRGVALFLFARAYAGSTGWRRDAASVLGPSLLFGLGHAIGPHGGLRVAWLPFAYAFALGCWFGLVRLRSGSLLGAVLAHNAANVAGEMASALP